ncbi:MAG: hypothetical protein ACI4V1_10865 [Eubacteriales bacterium]
MKRLLCMLMGIAVLLLFNGCGGRSTPDGVPEDFAVYYADWVLPEQKNIFDTYEGYIQKDLIRNGIAKTEYMPSDEVITAIYDKIVELKLYEIPEDVRAEEERIQPMTYFEVRFTMNGKTCGILADATIAHNDGLNEKVGPEEAERVNEFCRFMKELMIETEEYQSFPEREGGYM